MQDLIRIKFLYGDIPSEEDIYRSISTTIIKNDQGTRLDDLALDSQGYLEMSAGSYQASVVINGISAITNFTVETPRSIVLNIPDIYSAVPFPYSKYKHTLAWQIETETETDTKNNDYSIYETPLPQGILIYISTLESTRAIFPLRVLELKLYNQNHEQVTLAHIQDHAENPQILSIEVQLPVGLYFLHLEEREAVIWVVEGKTTFIFLLQKENAILAETTKIVIANRDQFLADPQNALIDVLLNKLQNHSWSISDSIITKAINSEFTNSYLNFLICLLYAKNIYSLFSGQAKSLQSHNTPAIDKILILRKLIQVSKIQLPDIHILERWAENIVNKQSDPLVFTDPPLLRATIDFAIELSFTNLDAIPQNSYFDHVVSRQFYDIPTTSFSPLSHRTLERILIKKSREPELGSLKLRFPGNNMRNMGRTLIELIHSRYPFNGIGNIGNPDEYENLLIDDDAWIVTSLIDYSNGREANQDLLSILKRLNLPYNTIIRALEEFIYYEEVKEDSQESSPLTKFDRLEFPKPSLMISTNLLSKINDNQRQRAYEELTSYDDK